MEWLSGIPWWGILSVLVGVAFLILFFIRLSRHGEAGDGADAYVAGLNALLNHDQTAALEYLRKAVRNDSDNIDAYLKLGTLYRTMNDPNRAYTIHSELTVRSRLRKTQRIAIFRELAEDQLAMGARAEALDYANSILRLDRRNLWVRQFQLRVYEDEGDWDHAYRLLKELFVKYDVPRDSRLACYRIEQGRTAYENDRYDEALDFLEKALKESPDFVMPYILKGDTLLMKGMEAEAVAAWRQALLKSPANAALIYDRLEKVHFNQGRFDEMEAIYSNLLEKQPAHQETLLRLAEYHFKKGMREEAVRLADTVAEQHPDSIVAQVARLRYGEPSGIDAHITQLWTTLRAPQPYRCSHCGTESVDMVWRCETCHHWCTYTAC
jgi:lipopolysaccharide assembly protein B